MENERDADDAIRGLDRIEFGRKGRRLRVEWTKGERGGDRRSGGGGGSRRSSSSMRPSKTLFVINFDADNTRTRDLERHFESYGKIVNVRIRRNFAFIQYEEQEDATRALEATNNSKLMDKVISVEYAMKDDDARGNGQSPDRRRDRSPERRRRSPSPYKRERGSPDYGRGGSPVAAYRKERTSPDYGRRRSPSPYKRSRRMSPEYGRDRRGNESPRRRERVASPNNKRERRSPDDSPFKKESPKNGGGEVESPRRERSRSSPENGQVESPSSIGRRDSDDGAESPMQKSRSRSPPAEE
ncbi:serine/arginine-rich splicing factor RS40 isoform X2 [Brassica rapa]|nr:serine/arginine-rich splicing factor RS40 isoform X2 [Brassica rapa]